MDGEAFDVIVLGAGLRGLAAALRTRRARPDARLLVVDAAPWPGGSVRTQRSNGFVCELGPFAFARDDVDPVLALLDRAPPLVEASPAARRGFVFAEGRLAEVEVDPRPVSFRTGNEELVQACRRELGERFRLGRAATAVTGGAHGFTIALGGEVPAELRATHLVLALPRADAARLAAGGDPALADVAARVRTEPRAFVFLGGATNEAPELRGYGILAREDVDSPLAEAIFCSEVFPGRALPGRFLVRCEMAGRCLAGNDEAVREAAEAELRAWTATRASFGFTKVHRFASDVADGASVECDVRLATLAGRHPGFELA